MTSGSCPASEDRRRGPGQFRPTCPTASTSAVAGASADKPGDNNAVGRLHSPADPGDGLLLLVMLAGAIAIPTLPIGRYPELAPPQVLTAIHGPTASVESAVTTPLESPSTASRA